jgi:hypothetical protein
MKNDLTIDDYLRLSSTEQSKLLWQHGFMMGKKKQGRNEVTIYRLFSFYAKIYYDASLMFVKQIKPVVSLSVQD